uniref:Small ribosomal subunit protein bS20c n=1 Tax=Thuretia quercifolia TaxID=189650 RepID=A0A1Z1MK03_9FLOR|nr:ribosomal protein S20 [Thuretia quercifolia]ARW66420.1 ribosomal protein S20 [Thuretia quercifolia]
MSKNLSAIKRVQISLRNRLRNRKYKLSIKKSVKKYLLGIKQTNTNDINFNNNNLENLSMAYKKIDKAVQKGVLHKNKGDRKKSRLAKIIRNTLK